MMPRSTCSVPTKLWLKRLASLRASRSTCCARGVKLFAHSTKSPAPLAGASVRAFQNDLNQVMPRIRAAVAIVLWSTFYRDKDRQPYTPDFNAGCGEIRGKSSERPDARRGVVSKELGRTG